LWLLGGYRGIFCETLPEASPMSDRVNVTSSEMDPLLAEAEPISDGGSTSVIIYLRRVKKLKLQRGARI